MIQYQGCAECGHEDVQLLAFFGDMYARDPQRIAIVIYLITIYVLATRRLAE